jgi:hypothetical protein
VPEGLKNDQLKKVFKKQTRLHLYSDFDLMGDPMITG